MTNDQRMVDVGLLRPFVALLQEHNDQGDDSRPVFAINDALITLGDLRKLRALLDGPGVEPVASNTKAAGEAIELVFDERNWPANPAAAARCGWEACLRTNYLAAPSAPVPEWPVLDKPALVGGGRFHVGVSARLVVEAAQRHYEYEVTPEKEAERIARAAKAIDALVAPVQAVPDGWQLINRTPTPEQRELLLSADEFTTGEMWIMLLAAAPQPPKEIGE